ncbi:PH domain-containing protein [Actinomadura vinacea]|uniref:PH domain-containing protein n=1 Tax=Actinomadura vinacea TaxID=115336 RepID=A0ABP5WU80_9ACTN
MTTPRSRELRPPRNPIERKAVRMWTVVSLVLTLPPVLTLALLTLLIPPARPWLAPWLAATAVISAACTLVVPRRMYAIHRWEVTGEAVYTLSGCFWRRWRVAPLSRIQTVDSLRGPFQQMFGLAGIAVTTASAAGPIRIRGLDAAAADDLLDTLTKATQRTPGDAS